MGDMADYYRGHQLENMAISDDEDREFHKRPYWHTIDSKKLWIDEMDDLHIDNALSQLERNGHGSCREAEAFRAKREKR